MEWIAQKTFDRNGVRYRRGDKLPDDLDKVTVAHYQRNGMIQQPKPEETKPAGPAESKPAVPKKPRAPVPQETKSADAPADPAAAPADLIGGLDQQPAE